MKITNCTRWPDELDDAGEQTLEEFADSQADYYRELFADAAQEAGRNA